MGLEPPMVYVEEELRWEYKQLARTVERDEMPTEEELNELGKHGWELVGTVTLSSVAYFYFKRPAT